MSEKKNHLFSMQTELIRQMQVADGLEPCYDTPATKHCKDLDCCWRYDCYVEKTEQRDGQDNDSED